MSEMVEELGKGFRTVEVSNLGNVRGRDSKKPYRQQVQNGYHYIMMFLKGGKRECQGVHRLVAYLFVPGQTKEKREVDHIDGNRGNNKASNLRGLTPFENGIRTRS